MSKTTTRVHGANEFRNRFQPLPLETLRDHGTLTHVRFEKKGLPSSLFLSCRVQNLRNFSGTGYGRRIN